MMLRRKPLIFFTLVFAIFALFAVSEVLAFCDYCDADAPTIFSDPSGWKVEFDGITSVPTGCTGVDPNTGAKIDFSQCYRFNYKISNSKGTVSGLNFFEMFIADCCDSYVYVDNEETKTDVESAPGNLKIFGVGEGTSSGFGARNKSGYAIQGTPDYSTDWSILTNTKVIANLPASLKVRNTGYLPFEITGPGCATAAGSVTYEACVNWYGDPLNTQDDVSFYVTRRGDAKGCIETLQACVGTGCQTNCAEITPDDLPGDYVSSGALSGQTCDNEVVDVKTGSPFYLYQVVSGGYVFRGCLDLGAGNWTDLGCCTGGTCSSL